MSCTFTCRWIDATSSSSPRSPARAPRSRAAAIPSTSSFGSFPTKISCPASRSGSRASARCARAGCGLTVRVMEGDVEVVRNGQPASCRWRSRRSSKATRRIRSTRAASARAGRRRFRSRITPIGSRTAEAQRRARQRRSSSRSRGTRRSPSWSSQLDALAAAGNQKALAFLTRGRRSRRQALLAEFLKRLRRAGADSPSSSSATMCCAAPTRSASAATSCRRSTSRARATSIAFGADFLGTWNSPVAQSAGVRPDAAGPAGRARHIRAGRAADVADRRERRRMGAGQAGHRGRAGARPRARDPREQAASRRCRRPRRRAHRRVATAVWPTTRRSRWRRSPASRRSAIERLARELAEQRPAVAVDRRRAAGADQRPVSRRSRSTR